jgi:hypothetical protein
METEADVAVALQRAAERLDGLGAAEGPITEAAPDEQAIEEPTEAPAVVDALGDGAIDSPEIAGWQLGPDAAPALGEA